MARAAHVGLTRPSCAPHNANICLTTRSYWRTIRRMRTFEFRLYPNRVQRHRLDACLYQSRQLYNEMLAREKQHYQETGRFLSKYDLTALFKGRGGTYVPATTVQCLAIYRRRQCTSEIRAPYGEDKKSTSTTASKQKGRQP